MTCESPPPSHGSCQRISVVSRARRPVCARSHACGEVLHGAPRPACHRYINHLRPLDLTPLTKAQEDELFRLVPSHTSPDHAVQWTQLLRSSTFPGKSVERVKNKYRRRIKAMLASGELIPCRDTGTAAFSGHAAAAVPLHSTRGLLPSPAGTAGSASAGTPGSAGWHGQAAWSSHAPPHWGVSVQLPPAPAMVLPPGAVPGAVTMQQPGHGSAHQHYAAHQGTPIPPPSWLQVPGMMPSQPKRPRVETSDVLAAGVPGLPVPHPAQAPVIRGQVGAPCVAMLGHLPTSLGAKPGMACLPEGWQTPPTRMGSGAHAFPLSWAQQLPAKSPAAEHLGGSKRARPTPYPQ